MLTISPPLSAPQAKTYYAHEFAAAQQEYYTQGGEITGQWHGRLAADWGLVGDVTPDHYNRLAEGKHPVTGEALVRHQTRHTTTTAAGETVTSMAHRAGWDATFSAWKSASLTALVGGDEAVRRAHDAAVRQALDVAIEPYVQARLGGNIPPATTGTMVAAVFPHNSARPVDGYAAPQLHTHVVLFNLTALENGDVRSLQPREIFRSQSLATAVYQSAFAARVTALGYQVVRDPTTGTPAIVGYTEDYLKASSPRRTQIEDRLASLGRSGARAAQLAAHQTREAKVALSPDVVKQQHQDLAAQYGNQPAHVRAAASQRPQPIAPDPRRTTPEAAVTFAKTRNLEREAVVDERQLLRDALVRSMGERTVEDIRTHLATRVATAEFVPIPQRAGVPGRHYSTPEMIALERDNVRLMREAQGQREPLASADLRRNIQDHYPHLNADQRAAVDRVLTSHDGVQALDGVAGAGKTTALAAIRDAAERAGYRVEGLAPTSRAAAVLHEAGIPAQTLQRHVAHPPEGDARRHLYVLDESSLASTVQVHQFLTHLHARDRVLLVGDVRQHQAVDAGIPYQQLQHAGASTTTLRTILRQRDPALRGAVERLAEGHVASAIDALASQGRVHALAHRDARFTAIAADYASDPTRTLVVSPDNASRADLNTVIHQTLQRTGQVEATEQPVRVLVARQELTGADRQWASRYQVDDLVRYTKASTLVGVQAGDYARVVEVRPDRNQIRVRRDRGGTVTYDPRRAHGVTVYQEAERPLAVGDRVQFTAPDRRLGVANRQLATVDAIGPAGALRLTLDQTRREVIVDTARKHVDLGYVLTSHSSQGQTADRVLVHVDTDQAGERLVNRRMAYVALSRGRHDARIYTNDPDQLVHVLSRDVSHPSALRPDQVQAPTPSATRAPSAEATPL